MTCTQEVVHAEAFISGFGMEYLNGDNHIQSLRAMANILPLSEEFTGKNKIAVTLEYSLSDDDPSDDEDMNQAGIHFTVIALTKPHSS